MKTDAEIAHEASPQPIEEIAQKLGLDTTHLHPYGRDKAKIDLSVLKQARCAKGPAKLVLVSALTPTPAGEGKTTTTIGLGQAFTQLGESICLALREPSLGPCMGVKGGATGGGYSQIVPAESINLHFTGDFHAITSAHNLLAAALDNHMHFGNALDIDPRRVVWRRVMDMNDRSLRHMVIGMGGPLQGVPRETGFDITAASEIMAILCLATDLEDLRARIDQIVVGYTRNREPVTADKLKVTGAMLALLKDAMMPNLVQTLEGTPTLLHGGPFANIAHGCNSLLATKMAMHLAEWTITEAGFGFDLGAEKFFDLKCQIGGLDVASVVLVATVRALKMHGGISKDELQKPSPEAVQRGLPNLKRHIESANQFGKSVIVALNRFGQDTDEEIDVVKAFCEQQGVAFACSDHFAKGGQGALTLAKRIIEESQNPKPLTPMYQPETPLEDKIAAVATRIYGAKAVEYTKEAQRHINQLRKQGYGDLPICIAKTQSSLSDDPSLLGRPTDFTLTVREITVNAGAGFLVVLTGDIMRMPGLPRIPQAEHIELQDGQIVGLR